MLENTTNGNIRKKIVMKRQLGSGDTGILGNLY